MPRSPHVALQLRLPPELHARLVRLAQEEHRSLTSLIIHVMSRWADDQERQQRAYPRVAEGDGPPYRPHGE